MRFALPLAALLAACSSTPDAPDAGSGPDAGETDAGTCVPRVAPPEPHAIALDGVLPALQFEGPNGTPIALHDLYEPCAERLRYVLVRSHAAWCSTCRWEAAHTTDLRAEFGDRVRVIDLLVADEDNAPPDRADLATFMAQLDAPDLVALDPAFSLGPVNDGHEPLPFVVLVDRRTMKVEYAAGDPDMGELRTWIREELARKDRRPIPELPPSPDLIDGRFTRKQWDLVQGMHEPGAPPPDPTNAWADDAAAAAFGRTLFSDASLSPAGKSCASCHPTDRDFVDRMPTAIGTARGDRNTPSVLFAAHARSLFWDGRADTLWMQALGPFENEKEMASTRLFVAHRVVAAHRRAYERVFGSLPDLSDPQRFPGSGKPGQASWDGMEEEDRAAVTGIYVHLGKAIAAYERTLRAKPSRFDAYVAGDATALSNTEKDALLTFLRSGCVQCHHGPRLTDDAFHNVRFPTGHESGVADRGRIDGIAQLAASEFVSVPPGPAHPSMLGAFRTPALRGVVHTAPYGHGGTFATLREVLVHYSKRGLPADDPRALGSTEPWVPKFSENHADEILPFLEALTAEPIP